MNEVHKRHSLGRGLASLLGEPAARSDSSLSLLLLPVEQLLPSPHQPRKVFNEETLQQLAESIEQQGVLQPLLVRPLSGGQYEIVAGERRWRATQRTSRKEVPAIVVDYTDRQVVEVALIENIQRDNLNPVEEAESYKKLIEEHQYTQDNLGKIIGKSRSHIANMLRLLTLPPKIQDLLIQGVISMGHARALLSLENPEDALGEILGQGLSVRQIEKMGRHKRHRAVVSSGAMSADDEEKESLEKQLELLSGLKVSVTLRESGGLISMSFNNFGELDSFMERLHKGHVSRETQG
jgi:ParB family chromosome partitioning protein